jgi:hypothetical protein
LCLGGANAHPIFLLPKNILGYWAEVGDRKVENPVFYGVQNSGIWVVRLKDEAALNCAVLGHCKLRTVQTIFLTSVLHKLKFLIPMVDSELPTSNALSPVARFSHLMVECLGFTTNKFIPHLGDTCLFREDYLMEQV